MRCPDCPRGFADALGLESHRLMKHGVPRPERPESMTMGEFWAPIKEARRKARMTWHSCPTCEIAYGTGTKFPPGGRCHRCGYSESRP